MTKHPFDPVLKEIVDRLKTDCAKHDVGCAVSLVSKTNGEFFMHPPTWTAVKVEHGQVTVKIKSQPGDDPHEAKKLADATIHYLQMSKSTLDTLSEAVDHLYYRARKAWKTEVSPGQMQPHIKGITEADSLPTNLGRGECVNIRKNQGRTAKEVTTENLAMVFADPNDNDYLAVFEIIKLFMDDVGMDYESHDDEFREVFEKVGKIVTLIINGCSAKKAGS